MGPKNSDKFEATECIYPILPLQNGRFTISETHVAKRRFMRKLDLKDAYFSVPLEKNSGQFVFFRW